MRITAATTHADIQAPVTAARKALMDSTAGLAPVDHLVARVNDVAGAEATAAVCTVYLRVFLTNLEKGSEETAREAALTAAMTYVVGNGPDDAWSGRGNDARRAGYDAMLRTVQDLRFQY